MRHIPAKVAVAPRHRVREPVHFADHELVLAEVPEHDAPASGAEVDGDVHQTIPADERPVGGRSAALARRYPLAR